jgi:hypothetical protein
VNIFGFANLNLLTAEFGILVKFAAAILCWFNSERFGGESLSVIHVYRHLSV